MLHIITPLYRFDNLEKIYYSILINEDIRWHVSYSHERELPNLPFLKEDKRIILHKVECLDTEVRKKRNAALENISEGYFCFLDDDTLFHENMYSVYDENKNSNFKGMVVGEQLTPNGGIRLTASIPIFQKIDWGNVLCHHSVINHVEYPTEFNLLYNGPDHLFWKSVYEHLDNKCKLINIPISYYNKISGVNLQVIRNLQNNKIISKRQILN